MAKTGGRQVEVGIGIEATPGTPVAATISPKWSELSIQGIAEKTLLKIKEAAKEVRVIHGRLEPLVSPENRRKLEDFYEKSPVLLRR